jgi:hypothetical protein
MSSSPGRSLKHPQNTEAAVDQTLLEKDLLSERHRISKPDGIQSPFISPGILSVSGRENTHSKLLTELCSHI